MPPIADGVALPWDDLVADPVTALAEARSTYGETFVVDSGPDRYLFTFDPVGVRSFYRLPEERASKGVADWRMLRRKMPEEIFDGRRVLPHDLFGRNDVANYVSILRRALVTELDQLGAAGEVDVFALSRRLGQRIGLASWAGPAGAAAENFDILCAAFDVLDGSESFVRPDTMAAIESSDKAAERQALQTITELIGATVAGFEAADDHPLFARVVAAWADQQVDVAAIGAARDVALIHIASMSNLFAALGWVLVDLIERPTEQAAIVAGDQDLAEQCALESTRLAQRSLMARYTLATVELEVTGTTYAVDAGVTVATLLPLTNTTAAPGLDQWRPERWRRWRLTEPSNLAAAELVTAFGHGKHSCPAQPFSLAAMTASATAIFGALELTAQWAERPVPEPTQIGGVARAAGRCLVRYRRNS
jgi:cytochrome P450